MNRSRNNLKLAKGNGPYQVILHLDFQDTDVFALYARRQYRTLKLATEALPGVRLKKRADDYDVIFGGRQIGILAKAEPVALAVTRSMPRYGIRHALNAVALAISAVIGRFI